MSLVLVLSLPLHPFSALFSSVLILIVLWSPKAPDMHPLAHPLQKESISFPRVPKKVSGLDPQWTNLGHTPGPKPVTAVRMTCPVTCFPYLKPQGSWAVEGDSPRDRWGAITRRDTRKPNTRNVHCIEFLHFLLNADCLLYTSDAADDANVV